MPLVNNTLPKRGFDIIAAKIDDASLNEDANYKPPVTQAEKRTALKAKSLIATKLVNSHFKGAYAARKKMPVDMLTTGSVQKRSKANAREQCGTIFYWMGKIKA